MFETKVPKIYFKGFNKEWKDKRLGDISILTSSKRIYYSDYSDKGIPFYRGKEITDLQLGREPSNILYISNETYEDYKVKYGIPQIGDILITAVGTLGNVLKIKDDKPFYFKDGNLIWIKNIIENSDFLEVLLEVYHEEVNKTSIGSTQRALTMVELRKLNLKLPSIEEQIKISNYFQNLDKLIEEKEKKQQTLKQLKKAMLSKMFPKEGADVPEIRFDGFSGVWEEKKLGEIINLCSGRDYKHLSKGKIPVYGTGGYMLSVDEALSYDTDAIGIGRKGTIDKPYVLKAPFWTVDTLFYAIPKKQNYLPFIYNIFQKINWKQKDESTGVPSLSKIAINGIEVFSSKFDEQTKIGNYFQKLDKLIDLQQKELEKLKNIKKASLDKMFV